MKRKSATKETDRQRDLRESKRFLWHLQPPWRDEFSHDHWWERLPEWNLALERIPAETSKLRNFTVNNEQVSVSIEAIRGINDPPAGEKDKRTSRKRRPFCGVALEAAMWEIFRRHPRIGETLGIKPFLTRLRASDVSLLKRGNENFRLAALSRRAWPELPKYSNRQGKLIGPWQDFLKTIPPQHGYYPNAVEVLEARKFGSCLSPKKRAHELEDLHEEINRNHIYEEAVAAEMGGRLLINLDPFAPNVGKEVEKIAAKFRRSDRAQDKGEARVIQWLQAISRFEKEAIKCQTGKILDDQNFASYRRIIGPWDWAFRETS